MKTKIIAFSATLALLMSCFFILPTSAAESSFTITPGIYEFNSDSFYDDIFDNDQSVHYYVDGVLLGYHSYEIGSLNIPFSYLYASSDGAPPNSELWLSDDNYSCSGGSVVSFTSSSVRVVVSDPALLDEAVSTFKTSFTLISASEPDSVSDSIFPVFTQIITWFVGALGTVVALFWADGSLTFFGILTLIALGIALFFLLIRVIQNFLRFRS